MGRKSIL